MPRPLVFVVIAALLCATETPVLGGEAFGNWQASCRADSYCAAAAIHAKDGAPGNVLRLGRHAEEVWWEVSLTTPAAVADPAHPFTIAVDGATQDFAGPRQVGAYGSGTDFFFLGDGVQAVMDRLPPASTLTVHYTDMDGSAQQADFPLAGLNAALIWIDEQQSRLGSERVAEAPPIGLAPIDPQGALLGQIPPRLLAQHESDTDCQPIAELPTADEIVIDPTVGDGVTLYILPCSAAAYNFGWKAYVSLYEGRFTNLALPEYTPEDGWTATTHLLNIYYDPETRELSAIYKGRAAGDCGSSGLWRWQPHTFRLVEYREKSACDGVELPDDEFPLVWPEPAAAN